MSSSPLFDMSKAQPIEEPKPLFDMSKAQPIAPAEQPGPIRRGLTSFREGVGLPANPIEDITQGVSAAVKDPAGAAKSIAMSPVEGYKAAVQQQHDRMEAAYNRGDYGQAVLHGLYYLLAPVGGAQMGKATEQAVQGDIAGSAGSTAAAAVPYIVGSPEARANIAVPVNAARNLAATGLEKSAGPASTLATVYGAGHELMAGRPYSAAVVGTLGKPAISKTINSLADFIRPGENVAPMPVSHSFLQNALESFKSPEEKPAATVSPEAAQAVYEKAAIQELPKTATPKQVSLKAAALKARDEQTAAMLDDAIAKLREQQPANMEGLYGKTPTKSNLLANQRQLASPTGSTAPVPASPAPSRFSLGSMKNFAEK